MEEVEKRRKERLKIMARKGRNRRNEEKGKGIRKRKEKKGGNERRIEWVKEMWLQQRVDAKGREEVKMRGRRRD